MLIRKEGERLILEPARAETGLLEYLATLKPSGEQFPDVDETLPPLDDVKL